MGNQTAVDAEEGGQTTTRDPDTGALRCHHYWNGWRETSPEIATPWLENISMLLTFIFQWLHNQTPPIFVHCKNYFFLFKYCNLIIQYLKYING